MTDLITHNFFEDLGVSLSHPCIDISFFFRNIAIFFFFKAPCPVYPVHAESGPMDIIAMIPKCQIHSEQNFRLDLLNGSVDW